MKVITKFNSGEEEEEEEEEEEFTIPSMSPALRIPNVMISQETRTPRVDIIGSDMGKLPLVMTLLIMKILGVEMTCFRKSDVHNL